MNNLLKRSLLISFIGILLSCSTATKHQNINFHDLGPVAITQEGLGNFVTTKISAPEWLSDNKIHYRQLFVDPTVLRSYTLDKWLATPAELLEQQLHAMQLNQSVTLHISLITFEQQFETAQQAKSVLAYKVEVYKKGEKAAIARRVFVKEQYDQSADAAGTVHSFSQMVKKSITDLAQWLNLLT